MKLTCPYCDRRIEIHDQRIVNDEATGLLSTHGRQTFNDKIECPGSRIHVRATVLDATGSRGSRGDRSP